MGIIDSDNEDLHTPILSPIENKQRFFPDNMEVEVQTDIINPPKHLAKNAYIKSMDEYTLLYQESIRSPDKFWEKMASEFCFKLPPGVKEKSGPIFDYNFDHRKGPIFTKFFEGYETNVCYNMLDKHIINGKGNRVAFYWEGNDAEDSSEITYNELYEKVCRFSNVLKSLGVQKGDIVAIYMPMVVEIVVAMLACVRIGAVHSVVFAGYSAQALADRLIDGNVKVLLTTDGSWRGEKFMALKEICDNAIIKAEENSHIVPHCVVLQHLRRLRRYMGMRKEERPPTSFYSPRDKDWEELSQQASVDCPPVWVDSEHPMFTLYTSGSTGRPKGIVHATGGYMVFASTVFKYTFDFHPERDVFWCTSDMGWCCAHTNIVYGPLSLGGTSLLFEGVPFYPDITRPWSIIDKYNVSVFYTAPTVLRHLMKFGDQPVLQFKRDSLRVLATVGEPINPTVWTWYFRVVGGSRCPIVDTYGQTETGAHLLTSVPGATPTKPGAVGLPFFGSVPVLLTKEGVVIEGAGEGCLAFKQPWPSVVRTVHGDKGRFEESYFRRFPGYYCTGDAARRDQDGFYWITGRIDDMLNVSGHLISTTSVESAILEHKGVAEAAVVPIPHEIKGQCLYAFVILKEGFVNSTFSTIVKELQQKVREKVGSFAAPDTILVTPVLPMTRSGKILRRVLVSIATKNCELGDTSTLVDESVLDILMDLVNNNNSSGSNYHALAKQG